MSIAYRHVLFAGLVGLAGCQLFTGTGGTQGSSYPSTPPGGSTTAPVAATPTTTPTVVKVPADAIVLSSGDYPPPSFPAPTQPGLIEVVDMDEDPTVAVATTSVSGTGSDAAKMMSITDVMNMSVSLNKNHKYKIVFVPLKSGTPAP
jgi:hypothetical protein